MCHTISVLNMKTSSISLDSNNTRVRRISVFKKYLYIFVDAFPDMVKVRIRNENSFKIYLDALGVESHALCRAQLYTYVEYKNRLDSTRYLLVYIMTASPFCFTFHTLITCFIFKILNFISTYPFSLKYY